MDKREAFRIIEESQPKHTYRGAVIGCGRMGSTIDDEHIGMPHYPWPWAHAPAMIEAKGVELVAGADVDPAKLEDFKRRWGVTALYTDFREMVEKEQPDIVSVTTRPGPRAEVTIALAEMSVKAIFATKPMCNSLEQADAMIEACRKSGTILAIACHLNWYNWYNNARKAIADGAIGRLLSMICHSPSSLSNLQSHTLALFRLFAGAPAKWVFGHMDDDERAAGNDDLSGSGYIVYEPNFSFEKKSLIKRNTKESILNENGVRAFMNSHSERSGLGWTLEFIGEKGRIISRNAHAQFELWSTHPETGGPIQCQFPNPWHPRSSMVDAIEGVCRSIEEGEEKICPGEFGKEALEIAIAMRESHRRGGVKIELPLEDRSLRIG